MKSDLHALFTVLVRFETELWNSVDLRLRDELDLPLSWFEPMHVVSDRGSCRVCDIATELGITVGGASKVLDLIEAAGYLVRRPNPADHRSSILELSTEGKTLMASATLAFEDELRVQLGSAVIAAVRAPQSPVPATSARLSGTE